MSERLGLTEVLLVEGTAFDSVDDIVHVISELDGS